jgi:SAM-dependent methyltransferase
VTRVEMHQQLAKRLRGSGVEFGAGAHPFPVSPDCRVQYGDRNTPAQLAERNYFDAGAKIAFDFQSDIRDMVSIDDDSMDFIIGSHVIEHTPDPIGVLITAYCKLRFDGVLLLVVPDKEVTFDRLRSLTTLDHLLSDYLLPSRHRDFEHYIEFFRLSFPQPDPIQSARATWERGDDIHFHTWTYQSFDEMVRYVAEHHDCRWRDVWSHPRLSDQELEFYYVLTK